MISLEEFLKNIIIYNKDPKDLELISKAYLYAHKMHEGQKRQSGEEYFIHPLSVAFLMIKKHADAETIAACLLHDVVEDTTSTLEEVEQLFGKNVALLVDGVTKKKIEDRKKKEVVNIRKIVTSLGTDIRIIQIKLADRLHNMSTLEYVNEEKQKRIAKETLDIYVPLAYNLGEYVIKTELEDLCLFYLDKEAFTKTKEIRDNLIISNTSDIRSIANNISYILEDKGIQCNVSYKFKNVYGIYDRINTTGDINKIHDLISIVVKVNTKEECYLSLMDIHDLCKPYNSYFKDYICSPKNNLYQSLHTTLFAPNNMLIQVQIRTNDMDLVANNGLSAYYKIDFNNAVIYMQTELNNKLEFIKSINQIDEEEIIDEEFVYSVLNEVFSKKVYVFDTFGKITELPIGSTIIDYAYKTRREEAHSLVRAFVNDEEVVFNKVLKSNDIIFLEFNKEKIYPDKSWSDFAKTSHAKRLILGKRK